MTKWILFFLFFFVVATFLGVLYFFAPATVTITWLNYEIQFSGIGSLVCLILLLFVIFLVSRIVSFLYSFVVHFVAFFQRSKGVKEHTQSPPPSVP